ncbi:glutamate synthase (NADPH/NADH) small chain [Ligilactobacillus sp. WC1T17]|uniref:Glutamate synthase (NADPH/NADH) small chain n=1 Tax=Ligilactobacillus ruminis TaxID=1623 RepID=A0ABY1ACU0_9LACO|nr:glutamate synthase (NADPH/NADH) small chain [Ligilactobacillus ruminis]
MADPFGFMKYERLQNPMRKVDTRILDFDELEEDITEEQRRLQAARCMNCGVPHCHAGQFYSGGRAVSGCPNDNLIPEWNDLIYRKEDWAAFRRLTLTNPLPEFTGLVCPAPCEVACNEALHDKAVTIRNNEHYIIETAFKNDWVKQTGLPQKRNGLKIAIVGSGPSGLACAWRLNQLGYTVTVYEKSDQPGGLLMYGIPNMKLPKEMVKRRVDLMKEVGITFVVNTEVGADVKAQELLANYDKVVLTIGAGVPRDLSVPGREFSGIYFAVDYLTKATKEVLKDGTKAKHKLKGKKVLVIGGGDTGNDCIATAIRQGASDITQLEITRRPPRVRQADNPWPQWPRVEKVGYGQEEAQFIMQHPVTSYEKTAVAFKGENGRVKSATVAQAQLFKPVKGTEKEIPCDLVLIAMGFTGVNKAVLANFGVTKVESDGTTDKDQVYVAGDAKRGPSLVIWGIREGMQIAGKVNASCKAREK